MTELRITLSRRHCRGPGPLRPPGEALPHVECGTWSPGTHAPTFSLCHCGGKETEALEVVKAGSGTKKRKPEGRRPAWPEGGAAAAPARWPRGLDPDSERL